MLLVALGRRQEEMGGGSAGAEAAVNSGDGGGPPVRPGGGGLQVGKRGGKGKFLGHLRRPVPVPRGVLGPGFRSFTALSGDGFRRRILRAPLAITISSPGQREVQKS